PDAKTARSSVVWAMWIIGGFYIMTTFFGFGAAALIGPDVTKPNPNMSAPMLAQLLGGEFFFAFICAVAFATILAVVAGLTLSASTSFAHDFYSNVIHHGKDPLPGREVKVARITAFTIGALSITLAIALGPQVNVAFLVGLAFAVAASANLPAIIFSVFWKRFNTMGALFGLGGGLISSLGLILISPVGFLGPQAAIFPLENPGILSIPLELAVRSHTGLGAEKATEH
ncbi:MAG: cation acetate symporter, partial [Verrucomicrobia bacterium]